jgi:hypothetical protein
MARASAQMAVSSGVSSSSSLIALIARTSAESCSAGVDFCG